MFILGNFEDKEPHNEVYSYYYLDSWTQNNKLDSRNPYEKEERYIKNIDDNKNMSTDNSIKKEKLIKLRVINHSQEFRKLSLLLFILILMNLMFSLLFNFFSVVSNLPFFYLIFFLIFLFLQLVFIKKFKKIQFKRGLRLALLSLILLILAFYSLFVDPIFYLLLTFLYNLILFKALLVYKKNYL